MIHVYIFLTSLSRDPDSKSEVHKSLYKNNYLFINNPITLVKALIFYHISSFIINNILIIILIDSKIIS
jgi:hypothetical protein